MVEEIFAFRIRGHGAKVKHYQGGELSWVPKICLRSYTTQKLILR
jgi:hypothetical protein